MGGESLISDIIGFSNGIQLRFLYICSLSMWPIQISIDAHAFIGEWVNWVNIFGRELKDNIRHSSKSTSTLQCEGSIHL